jgi:hypothetical protein
MDIFFKVFQIISVLSINAPVVFKLSGCLLKKILNENENTCAESRIRILLDLLSLLLVVFLHVITFHWIGEK